MALFLNDVLSTKERTERSDWTETIEVIKKETTMLKSGVREFMKDKYHDLEPAIKPDELLLQQSEELVNNIKVLQNRINNQVKVKLLSSFNELQNLSLELKEYNYSLYLSNQLLEIKKCFESIECYNCSPNKEYVMIAITLIKLHSLLIKNSSDIRQLNIYDVLKEEYYKINENFIKVITSLWDEKIYWNEENTMETKSISLVINCAPDELTKLIQALFYVNKIGKCISVLSSRLLENLINPLIRYQCEVHKTDTKFFLKIVDKNQLVTYISVFENLKLIFEFLYHHFNIFIQNEEHFMTLLSNSLFQEFSTALTKDCISKIIPNSRSELETFEKVTLEIEKFQNFLIEMKFINDEQRFLSKFTNNIDQLYIDKKCEKLLETARNIMKKDLHDSFKYKFLSTESVASENFDENQKSIIKRKLSKYTFHFPECQISKSAQEILNLVYKILEEACHCSDKYIFRLFYTTRNIFEMYAVLVPDIHKSFLETIPHQVALFHNNCMYLAHNLLTLAHKFKEKISFSTNEFSIIYVDQVLLLRQVASKYFSNHMKYQRDIILMILQESDLPLIGQMPELPTTTERALRQCVRQLELLKTVWLEILPVKVYCRSLGYIINDFVDDLCFKVISGTDIPANIASELVTLLNMVVKRLSQIFPNPIPIEQYVLKWRRLKELIIILGASLHLIEDRWLDGKGPLANEFSPQHVKKLIRALFQNTERRSNLLSKIKEN